MVAAISMSLVITTIAPAIIEGAREADKEEAEVAEAVEPAEETTPAEPPPAETAPAETLRPRPRRRRPAGSWRWPPTRWDS